MAELNAAYLRSCLGGVKIVQLVLGLILLGILTPFWFNGGSCFGRADVGFLVVVNLLALVANAVVFFRHLTHVGFHKHEWIYATVCSLLFGLTFAWNAVDHSCTGLVFVLMFAQVFAYVAELLGLVGRCDCYIRVRSHDFHWTVGYEEMEPLDSRATSEYGSI
ncbi:hypothetical protein M3Y99_00445300 [Aphelenchoides fujianensis]|nr:hypothetical protein M3Y99_00445300 [Aphelenchoides fujianensis]